jgi:glycosyltransferase involved in cell wall biosynthesis
LLPRSNIMSQLLINLAVVFSKPTGISNYALNLFPYLKSLNPTLLAAQNYADFDCYSIPDNLTPAQGSKGHFHRLIWTQFELPQIYQKLASKLVFSPIPEAPLYTNCRYIVQVHDLIPLRFPNLRSPLFHFYRYYVPQILEQAQHIVCNSQSTARDIAEFYGISAHKITPILLAYDASHFRPIESSSSSYFLYLGRQDPYKNLQRLLEAFAALVKKTNGDCKECSLWFAGPTDKRFTPTLLAQIEELGISKQVKFLDYVAYSELPKIINNAVALVFPSLWEGFGFPVLEAMACGTPVITSNLSSLPEIALDAAILINPYNTAEITAAMEQIVNDSLMREQLSKRGLERAKQFSWEKTGLRTLEVIKDFL